MTCFVIYAGSMFLGCYFIIKLNLLSGFVAI